MSVGPAVGKGRWIKCEEKQGQDGAQEDGQEPLSVLTGSSVKEVKVLQLVAFIADLTTHLAQESEKLYECPGEVVAIAGPTVTSHQHGT